MKNILMVVAILSLAAACAGGPRRIDRNDTLAQYLEYAGEPVTGFMSIRLQSWQPLSRDKLILWTGVNEAYLVTIWDTCRDLEFVHAIRITSTASQVTNFDHVLVDRDRCPIRQIRPIDVRQMKADRAANTATRSRT